MKEPQITVGQDVLQLIAEIDEFKGQWQALKLLSPERLQQLRKVATIESVGSSTRIEGAKLSDVQVETLLSNLSSTSFKIRDEQEVAGYAEAMDLVFQAYEESDNPDWAPWLGFFLRCLKKQKNNLAFKVKQEETASDSSLPLLSVQVLKLLGEHERLTIAQMVEFTGANQNTLKVRLRELVNDGRIKRHGKARATWYCL